MEQHAPSMLERNKRNEICYVVGRRGLEPRTSALTPTTYFRVSQEVDVVLDHHSARFSEGGVVVVGVLARTPECPDGTLSGGLNALF